MPPHSVEELTEGGGRRGDHRNQHLLTVPQPGQLVLDADIDLTLLGIALGSHLLPGIDLTFLGVLHIFKLIRNGRFDVQRHVS